MPPAAELSERRRVLITVTDDVLARQALSDDTWQAARRALTEREMIEACLLIGHYLNEAPTPGGPAIPRSR